MIIMNKLFKKNRDSDFVLQIEWFIIIYFDIHFDNIIITLRRTLCTPIKFILATSPIPQW